MLKYMTNKDYLGRVFKNDLNDDIINIISEYIPIGTILYSGYRCHKILKLLDKNEKHVIFSFRDFDTNFYIHENAKMTLSDAKIENLIDEFDEKEFNIYLKIHGIKQYEKDGEIHYNGIGICKSILCNEARNNCCNMAYGNNKYCFVCSIAPEFDYTDPNFLIDNPGVDLDDPNTYEKDPKFAKFDF